jgi:hypothetical protein
MEIPPSSHNNLSAKSDSFGQQFSSTNHFLRQMGVISSGKVTLKESKVNKDLLSVFQTHQSNPINQNQTSPITPIA